MASKNVKKRNWALILYPESAPSNWREILQETGLQCAISPLHDKDLDPTGEPKKAHYHVICCYSGPTSYNIVKGLTESLCSPIPQPLEQVRGYYRYLTHKDNPEKYQYNEADIQTVNGFSILDYNEMSRSEALRIRHEVQALIRDANILEFADLLDLLMDAENALAQYDLVTTHPYLFTSYIDSRRNRILFKGGKGGKSTRPGANAMAPEGADR